MAKFQLNSGETLIGSGMMSIYLKPQPGRRKLFLYGFPSKEASGLAQLGVQKL